MTDWMQEDSAVMPNFAGALEVVRKEEDEGSHASKVVHRHTVSNRFTCSLLWFAILP
jgi:hypothetical protein